MSAERPGEAHSYFGRVRAFLQRLKKRASKGVREELLGAGSAATIRQEAAFLREFKPDATAIEERPVPISIHATMYTLCALLVVAIIWAFVGTIDRIVVAQGKVSTTVPVLVLQPFAVSRILAIHVHAGDRVHKGDPLITFDPAFAKADESSLIGRLSELSATRERMEAEISGTVFEAGPDAPPERVTQAEIFQRRQSQLASELAERDSNLRKIAAQRASNRAAIAGLKKQVVLAHEVTQMRQTLKDKNIGSELQLVVAKKDELDTQQRLRDAVTQSSDLEHGLAQATAERNSYLENWRRQLSEDLVTARQQEKEAADALSKAKRLREFTNLVAPVDGVVLEIADRSSGSVLKEAETAVTLVPAGAALEVDADVLSKDIGYVSVGDPVRVKLEAYPFQKFGTIEGTLTNVSPDSVVREVGHSSLTVFHVTVHLKDSVDKLAARGIRLGPGLIATAEITTGRRSIASYVLYPVVRMFDEGMKEP